MFQFGGVEALFWGAKLPIAPRGDGTVADDVMEMHVDKTLYPFSPIILCCLNLYSQSTV